MPTRFSIKLPRTYNRENRASSINVAGETGYMHAENWK
jgi:hypothetical protein